MCWWTPHDIESGPFWIEKVAAMSAHTQIGVKQKIDCFHLLSIRWNCSTIHTNGTGINSTVSYTRTEIQNHCIVLTQCLPLVFSRGQNCLHCCGRHERGVGTLSPWISFSRHTVRVCTEKPWDKNRSYAPTKDLRKVPGDSSCTTIHKLTQYTLTHWFASKCTDALELTKYNCKVLDVNKNTKCSNES